MHHRPSIRLCLAAALVAALSGCATASGPQTAQYVAAAGAPVGSFQFFPPLWSWSAPDADHLAVYTRPNQAYLLDVGACPNLPFANVVAVTSLMHQVTAGFDKVLVPGPPHIPCPITRIRPLNLALLKSLTVQQRQIDEQPRPTGIGDEKPQSD